jgi:hypothetical protein
MNATPVSDLNSGELSTSRALVVCSLVIITALVAGVGLATGLVLRHVVQTLPLWVGVGLGLRRSRGAGWFVLPCFIFWLALMIVIWLLLLNVAHLVNGHFTPIEIVMTVLVGLGAAVGIERALRPRRSLPILVAAGLVALGAALQFACFRLSFLPEIVHR